MVAAARLDETGPIWAVLGEVADPEIPVISVVELGIVRSVEPDRVLITPTYTGCPAAQVIERDIRDASMRGLPPRPYRNALSPLDNGLDHPRGRASPAYGSPADPGGECPHAARRHERSPLRLDPVQALGAAGPAPTLDLFKCH